MTERVDTAFDRQHLWHPYTSALQPLPVYPVVGAKGCEIELEDGRWVVDGMASWWSVVHGYNHPALNAAVTEQIQHFSHVMFGGLTHQPAIELGKRLLDLMPPALDWVFLADSGSVAVEVALKQALQYWRGKRDKAFAGRRRFAAFRHGYHGDTFGAMSVTDPENGMHRLFSGFLAENVFLQAPPAGYTRPVEDTVVAGWREVLFRNRDSLAAVIVEPVVQGAGGMRIYQPGYLKVLRELCDEFDLLLIFDEIATGFGRTGEWFGHSHAGVCPDILTVGKALTGGMMTLAATLSTREVAETVCRSEAGVFMHGPTFMANPLACAAANASLQLLASEAWRGQVGRIERVLGQGLRPLASHSGVADVRVLGGIGVVEMRTAVPVADAQRHFLAHGVWIRPFGRLIYVMPPYPVSEAQLDRLVQAISSWINRD